MARSSRWPADPLRSSSCTTSPGCAASATGSTVTDANAVLRVLFSHLGKPYVGLPKAFSFDIPSVRANAPISIEKGADTTKKRVSGACQSSAGPALELRRGFQPKSR